MIATLTAVGAGTTIVDGQIVIGDVAPNAISTPTDTFIVRHDRAVPFLSTALVWSFSSDPTGDIGKDVIFGGPPPVNRAALNTLPKNPTTNRPTFIQLPEGSLEYDDSAPTPVTAVGGCTNWVTACYQPGVRELDDCARSAPACATDKPWLESGLCCPKKCFSDYRVKRLSGIPDLDAFFEVYVMDGSCFPGFLGLREQVKGE